MQAGKVKVMLRLLQQYRKEGRRVLIFSQVGVTLYTYLFFTMTIEMSGSNSTAEFDTFNDVRGNQYNASLNQTYQGPTAICKSFY